MGMFDNYDNLHPDYIPDNTTSGPSNDRKYLDEKLPKKAFNIKGTFIGYKWTYGDTFELVFNVNQTIKVYSNSIIYRESGKHPTTGTKGETGQQAYNLVDVKSWTCVGISSGLYIWVEDDCVSYPSDGDTEIVFIPNESENIEVSMKVEIYNFRWEPFDTYSKSGAMTVSVTMDKDTSLKYKPGVYYCLVKVLSGEKSTLQQKTMFIVE